VRVAQQSGVMKLNGSNQLTPSNDNSLAQYPKTGTARCPGSAAQPAGDGSNPFTAGGTLDCDPTIQTPGP
jgi:hypothetical protein